MVNNLIEFNTGNIIKQTYELVFTIYLAAVYFMTD